MYSDRDCETTIKYNDGCGGTHSYTVDANIQDLLGPKGVNLPALKGKGETKPAPVEPEVKAEVKVEEEKKLPSVEAPKKKRQSRRKKAEDVDETPVVDAEVNPVKEVPEIEENTEDLAPDTPDDDDVAETNMADFEEEDDEVPQDVEVDTDALRAEANMGLQQIAKTQGMPAAMEMIKKAGNGKSRLGEFNDDELKTLLDMQKA